MIKWQGGNVGQLQKLWKSRGKCAADKKLRGHFFLACTTFLRHEPRVCDNIFFINPIRRSRRRPSLLWIVLRGRGCGPLAPFGSPPEVNFWYWQSFTHIELLKKLILCDQTIMLGNIFLCNYPLHYLVLCILKILFRKLKSLYAVTSSITPLTVSTY